MTRVEKTSSQRLLVIGGGSAGIGVIASIKKRNTGITIILVEPQEYHYYQPAWTLVGGGVYDIEKTRRPMQHVLPPGVTWIKDTVTRVKPDEQVIEIRSGDCISYDYLIVASGLVLHWEKITGLEETLGRNGVTSNYRFDLASYTWDVVKNLKQGNAIFSQPPAPIKCAGAPQKALYLSSDYWRRQRCLENINVFFCLAGNTVFGIPEFVLPLQSQLKKYNARVNYSHTLIRVEGEKRVATFAVAGGEKEEVTLPFDMLHVVPPQSAPRFIADSGLGDADGWCDVDKFTLQHLRWPSIFSLGDCCSAPNAKTVAAVRKQIVIVANNLTSVMRGESPTSRYDGYGSCPLTVERGKVVLAEFGYGNRLLPTFPLDPTRPSRFAWWLKVWFLPRFYWAGMLRGVEWLTKSKM
ncbi:NAD(P)/FAD-dependent oxidoreductase [Serratia inhibens]|uniref:NAD(P)/FAD-dependent oxidoreductase n=1 Tax=Serratia inhibens TaxID=2338073 RepID=UPI0008097CCA|nr:FAD/NAD(P)-binding oxidoreductase [Serratia inhibens]ANS41611.1 Sulfide dehydrogenase [flavocytochrome c] flavoprotein chain [Serratia inhibens PRI-2C]